MTNRILTLCDYAAYYRIDIGFLIVAVIGGVLIVLDNPYGWLIAITFISLVGQSKLDSTGRDSIRYCSSPVFI